MSSPSRYALEHVQKLHAYTPGFQPETTDWIKLNTNENPYPASPHVGPAIQAEIEHLALYPSPISRSLRQSLAEHHGLNEEQLFVGNGSDDVLNLLMRAFTREEQSAGMMLPSYSLYPVLASVQNAKMNFVPYDDSLSLDVDAVVSSGAKLFYLTSPNAPTGVPVANELIEQIASRFDGILVVDEAYAPFAEEDAVSLIEKYSNIVVSRTFSKSHALAGLRVGYAMANSELIEVLDKVRDSYNVNRLSQAGAEAAIKDVAYYDEVIRKIKKTRDDFRNALIDLGYFVYPSETNFVFLQPKKLGETGAALAESLFEYLKENKILVRYLKDTSLTRSFIRISIGTPEQMQKTLEIINQWHNNA